MICPPFTSPTHRRIFEALLDGRFHPEEDLAKELWDELSQARSVRFHISTMRPLLNRYGYDVVAGRRGEKGYRLVRLISHD